MTKGADGRSPSTTESIPRSVYLLIALLGCCAASMVMQGGTMPRGAEWFALVGFVALLASAEWLLVRFRYRGQVNALNLFEAVLAPLIFGFSTPVVVVTVALGQALGGLIRRNTPTKLAFNSVQWAVAAGVGSFVYRALVGSESSATVVTIAGVLFALVIIGMINQSAFTFVLALADRRPPIKVITALAPVILPGWVIGWSLNSLIGVLYTFAYDSSPAALVLFIVPLVVLHAAYRGYAGARSDRVRLSGLHRASRLLAAPPDPNEAVASFLAEVAECFEAHAAELLFDDPQGITVHSVLGSDPRSYRQHFDSSGAEGLRHHLVAMGDTMRVTRSTDSPVSGLLRAEGWRDCLVSPLSSDEIAPGALVVYDQGGLEGFEEGERAVLEALARETAGIFEKGIFLSAIVQERRKVTQIVDTTSDGILTVDAAGMVRSWNRALESITGFPSEQMVGRGSFLDLHPTDDNGVAVTLCNWPDVWQSLPTNIQIVTRDGSTRWLSCSYTPSINDDGDDRVLVVVARDTTEQREVEQLREDVDRLSELEATQRARVLELQESLRPPMPTIPGVEFGVNYLPSDTTAPTGGDLYDWQLLPDGDVHVCVIDVLGSGVMATKDALAIIHTLRHLAFEGEPLESITHRTADLLSLQYPELVATALVARYSPRSGRFRLAGCGHPPAIVVDTEGRARQVEAPGIAFGWPGAGARAVTMEQLKPGDSLVLYTDGLVEARKDIIEGLENLCEAASQTRDYPVAEMARALVERSLAGAVRRDDSLALVLRHAVGDRSDGGGYAARYRAESRQVASIRKDLRGWLEDSNLDDEIIHDLVLVMGELGTNAVRAARSYIDVRVTIGDEGVSIEVEDDGSGFSGPAIPNSPPNASDDRGRGLFLVRTLVDEVSIRRGNGGAVVRCFKATGMRDNARGRDRTRRSPSSQEMLSRDSSRSS